MYKRHDPENWFPNFLGCVPNHRDVPYGKRQAIVEFNDNETITATGFASAHTASQAERRNIGLENDPFYDNTVDDTGNLLKPNRARSGVDGEKTGRSA